jgi:transcriptional regulator with XRE-family HTH domain
MRVNLRRVRERLFVTQAELAERTGVAESTISRIESGLQRPRISTIRKVAAGLGVPPEELIDWNGEVVDDQWGNAAASTR